MERTDAIARLASYALDRTASEFDRDALLDIVDAIKREAMEERTAAYNEGYDAGFASADDWAAQHEDAMAEHGWVRLPVDADGEYIRIGDVMEWPDTSTAEVVGIGDNRFFYADDGLRYAWASDKIHHHAPTVEDVLQEFTERVCDGLHTPKALDTQVIIAEFAAKLRLAGDE